MGWATSAIEALKQGNTVAFRPRGNSMKGKIDSGQLCTIEPLYPTEKINIDDIVLCKVHGRQYLHIVKAIRGNEVQIGNNKGYINGWTSLNQVYGKLVKVED